MGKNDPFAAVPKLQRMSTGEETAARIREMIFAGELQPGTPLTEIPLAEAFSVSRTAIREALMLLAREGIVTQHRHRGAVVTTFDDVDDLKDLYDARRLIEIAAIESSSAEDKEGLEALELAVENLKTAVDSGDWAEITSADLAFHQSLVALLHNSRLESFFAQLGTELRFVVLVSVRWDVDHGQSVIDDHREVLELLKAGRRKEAKEVLTRHLDQSEVHLGVKQGS